MKAVIVALTLVAGCAPQMPRYADMPSGPCMVTEALRMRYVGTDFKLSMREDVQRQANARVARVLRPDDSYTMDVREDRLNILLDDGGQVEGFRCG